MLSRSLKALLAIAGSHMIATTIAPGSKLKKPACFLTATFASVVCGLFLPGVCIFRITELYLIPISSYSVVLFDMLFPRLLLQHCFKELRSAQVATIHCSSQTTPQHVLQKLSQVRWNHISINEALNVSLCRPWSCLWQFFFLGSCSRCQLYMAVQLFLGCFIGWKPPSGVDFFFFFFLRCAWWSAATQAACIVQRTVSAWSCTWRTSTCQDRTNGAPVSWLPSCSR